MTRHLKNILQSYNSNIKFDNGVKMKFVSNGKISKKYHQTDKSQIFTQIPIIFVPLPCNCLNFIKLHIYFFLC